MKVSVNTAIVVEAVEDGGLVFDLNSGATTLINRDALNLLSTLRQSGAVDETKLSAAYRPECEDDTGLSEILASLEKSRLIFRC